MTKQERYEAIAEHTAKANFWRDQAKQMSRLVPVEVSGMNVATAAEKAERHERAIRELRASL